MAPGKGEGSCEELALHELHPADVCPSRTAVVLSGRRAAHNPACRAPIGQRRPQMPHAQSPLTPCARTDGLGPAGQECKGVEAMWESE